MRSTTNLTGTKGTVIIAEVSDTHREIVRVNEKPAARAKARAKEVNLKVVSQVSQKADQKVDRKEGLQV